MRITCGSEVHGNMAECKLRFEGKNLEELARQLEIQLPIVFKKHLTEILNDALNNLEQKAKTFVPVRTGFLQSTIYGERTSELTGFVGATAPYAFFVEFGTRFMRAQPYLRPALYNLAPELASGLPFIISDILRENLI